MNNLTSSQKSIWVTEQYYKGSSVNNISGFALIEEQIDFEKLEQAIQIVCQKHDNFWLQLKIEDGEVKQVLSERKKVKIDTMFFATKKELKEAAQKIARTPFNIEKSELFKFYIFKLQNGQGGFMPSIHHLISDAWTIALVSNEVIKAYSNLKHNQDVETDAIYSYIDYIKSEQEYLQSEKYQKDKSYWEEKFTQIPEVATIPGSKENADESNPSGNRIKFEIQASKVEEIKQYCKENKISLYNFFMAIYAIYIGEISNLDEFVIGTPILNRTNYKEKSAMGMFVNMAPFKINLNQKIDFKTFVKNIASDSMGMLKHQKYSYQHLLENLRNKNKSLPNLYNIFLSYQITNAHQSGEDMNYTIEWVYNGCCAEHIDIQIFDINDTGDLSISYDYKTSIYEESDIENLHQRILNIINQVIDKENINLRDVEIVTPEEKERLVTKFNKTELKYNEKETVISLFEKQAEKTPEKIAIISNSQKLTYKELNENANMLAKDMIEKGVKQKDIIGIMLNRSPEMIIGLVAILKCGATYLPIDPEYPAERISYMLENSETKLVLVNDNTEKYVPKECEKINIKNIKNKNKENINLKIDGNTLVYLIYTSGSTGKPKGVQITNRNLNNFIKGMKKEIDFNPNKTMVSVTTICFDIFGLEMWCSLTEGLTLVLANEQEQNMPSLLNKLCLENNVNMIQTTPSRYSVLFEDTNNLSFLKNITEILVGGEAVNDKILANMKKYSNARIFNVYGPTETTIWSTIKELTNEDKITVGKPIANTQCYILNKNHKLLPINIPGELYIGGDGVSNGYLKRDDLNEEKFIKSPFIKNSKIYNTNDLAYFTEDGEIVHLGRTDFQVKIRGFRIELGEIENAIEKNKNINQAVVVKRKLKNGQDVLVAYYTIIEDIEVLNELKQSLNKELPQYMVPQYFMKLEKMPHTPNGKIDRKALPEPEEQQNQIIVKPRNEIDKELIGIVEKLLRINQISIEDKLLNLGGDSLTAITLSIKILSKYNVQINIKDIISGFTIKDISDYIKENKEKDNEKIKIEKAPKQETYPLSSAQKRIYYNSKMIGDENLVYNMPGGIMVDEILDKEKVRKAFAQIIQRHSSLRTVFVLQENKVMQKIKENVDFDIFVYHNTESEIQQIIKGFSKPFKLDQDLLIRAELHYIDNKRTLLLVESHHSIMDGAALNNLIIEFERLYNGEDLKEIPIQYKDYAVWENKFNESEKIKKYEEYWVNKFKDSELSQLNLPYDYKMSASRIYKGNKISNIIDENQFRKIEKYAKKIGVSPYMLFISAFFILLYNYTGQEEITLGSPIANRDINETKRLIGMFVNNIVIKANIKSEETFQEFLNGMKEQILDDISNQPYPFDMLVKKLGIKGDNSRNPLFDVMFTYQNKEENMLHLHEHETQVIEIDNNIAKFNLSLEVKPKTHTINIEYCADLFKKQTIERFFEHYMNVIDCVVNDNNVKIADISIISEQEKNKILYEFNDTKIDYDKNKTISQLFEEQVTKTPNDIAIVFEKQNITYKELNEKANQVASYLRNKEIKPNDIIGIMLPRSLELLIAILGVLKSGACYIPIDPTYPEKRIEYMLNNSQAKLLITLDELYNNIEFENKIRINNEEIKQQNKQNLKNTNTPEDMSYIIYTSGSTGVPKGVILKHKSLSNLCAYLNKKVEFLQPECKYKNIASVTTASFDIFIFETLVCLQKGLKIILANEDEQRIPILLDKLISRNDVQIIQMTPSRMQIFMDNIKDMPNISNLKYVTLAGEALPLSLRNELIKLGVKKVYNGYGPSETTVFSTFTDVTNCEEINIGVPLGNTQMYILNKNLKVVPIGVAGELYIAGEGVGKGYLNREDITKERYIKNPFIENSIMYKTGDICKYGNTGEIYYLGRDDNQVKIRGLRIELEEIENKILEYPLIKKVKVIKKVIENREAIVAYFISTQNVIIPELRKKLYNSLPNYMVPSYFVELKEFPYTPNGKIDKNKLPEIEINMIDKTKKISMPTNAKEEKIIQIFKKVLKLEEIGIDDNFFEYGGDSISAIMLQTELLKENLQITYSDIFKYPTVRELTVQTKNSTKELNIEKVEEAEYYATSSAQKRMYLASSVEKSTLYNITGGILLKSDIDMEKLQEAINIIVDKQESLRTYFEVNEDGQIVQKIEPKVNVQLEIINTNTKDIDKIVSETKIEFSLNKAPLISTKAFILPNGEKFLLVNVHHSIFDGTSINIFLKELSNIYNGNSYKEVEISYKDYAVWEENQLKQNKFEKSRTYWKKQFDKDIPILNMPTTFARPAIKSYEGDSLQIEASKDLTDKIIKFANNNNLTPYMLLLASYYVLLYKYTGQEEIIVGSPISGRTHKELENVLGMFVNTLPLKNAITGEKSINKFLENVRENLIDAYSYQDYPFDALVNELNISRDSSRNPLFDTMFIYQNEFLLNIEFSGEKAQYYIPKLKTSKFDLTVETFIKDGKLNLYFTYWTKLFNKEFINNLAKHYINVIEAIVDDSCKKISEICILGKKERSKILYEFNDTEINYPKDKMVSELFEQQVEKNPNKIAVVFEEQKITYKELNEKANQLANYIRSTGIKPNDIVGIMLPRSIELISTIMGVRKSGACYIPIDPTYPQKRIQYMLENSQAKLLITNDKLYNNINYKNKISADYNNDEMYSQNNMNLDNINNNDDLAYVIYTSGSTGNPKGVKITNKNLCNFVAGIKDIIDFNENKTMVSVTTISFDIFGLEMWESLTSGLTLVIASENEQNIPSLLNKLCLKNNVNMIQTTPSRYSLMFEEENLQFLANMTDILVGGEPLEERILKKLKEISNAKIYNMYGPTETTIWSTVKDLTNQQKITIGKPIANTQVYVLDANLKPVPIGVTGELYIAGDGVGKGYLNREDITKERYLANPFLPNSTMYKTGDMCKFDEAGELYCLGRIDNQVKIRGLRIELDEIEKRILEFPNIKQVKVVKQIIGNREIISAYYIANKRINITELRTYLYKYLPNYMVPSYFTALDKFPYTPNGKIDKNALLIPKGMLKSEEKTYIAPKSDLEVKLVRIWEKLLNTKPIGITDNFFELGGDSILAMNLNTQLLKITNKINYADIFTYPTIAELSEKIEKEIKNNENVSDLSYLNIQYKDILEQNMETPSEVHYNEVGNVLLTGATGFLGIHILEELLKQEKGKIYVLIRKEPGMTVRDKLLNKLHYYFEDKYDKYIDDRIIIVEGQIAENGFGLNQEELFKLGNSIDCIINAAAKVSHYGKYSDFYDVNVKSVEKIINFADTFNLKIFHISTLSISGNTLIDQYYEETKLYKEIQFYENDFYVGQGLENVYVKSKFEAERRILDAISKGTDAYILRMGNLMPRILDGKFQDNISENAYLNRLKEIMKIGNIPKYLTDAYLEFTPIDSSAQATLKIMQFTNNKNRIYHIFNDDHVFVNKILKILKAENLKLDVIENEQFKQKINEILSSEKSNSIGMLVNDLDKDLNLNYDSKIKLNSEHSVKLLEKYGFKWQKINERYIKNILKLIKGEIENDSK